MNLLVDTHVLLWWLADDPALKRALGRLEAPDDLRRTLLLSGFDDLAITVDHASVAGALPRHHDDPFDRLLVAQALVEELTVLTVDPRFDGYGVKVLGTS